MVKDVEHLLKYLLAVMISFPVTKSSERNNLGEKQFILARKCQVHHHSVDKASETRSSYIQSRAENGCIHSYT